jgi:chromosome segregation ATPase
MDNAVIIMTAIVGGGVGAGAMTILGQWLGRRAEDRREQVADDAELARLTRSQEYADLMEFRQEQQRAMTSLRLEHRTLKEAHADLERRHATLDSECRGLAAQIEQQREKMDTLKAENLTLRNRVSELERENYRLYQQVEQLRKGQTP